LQENAGRDLMMGLPGMTEDVADAILDWMDTDEESREYGCESEYYQTLEPPYYCKNGPLDTVEELLLVRGVTPQLLFGSDTNRNGNVDPHEMNQVGMLGAAPGTTALDTSGVDTTLGSMDRGWVGYLTLYSQEKNMNSLGEPRIDLNMEDLTDLYDNIAATLNEDWAKFIVLYRQNGPYDGSGSGTDTALVEVDPSQPAKATFKQVLDLIGAKVQVPGQNDENTVVGPVFPDSPVEMMLYLPLLMDAVAVVTEPAIPGRINVNQAPRALLMGIPGIEDTTVEEIISQRVMETSSEDEAAAMKHETWLLTMGIVTLDQMKMLSPFVCAGGDVYRAQIVGYYEDGSAASRAEVLFDATGAVPRVLSWRDISHLGRGYPLEVLGLRMATGTGVGATAAPVP
jgi:DNA uptake protein ComE-like DNA-binding protein